MNIAYLCCYDDVPEYCIYSLEEAIELLPYKFHGYLEDDETDEQIIEKIKSLEDLELGKWTKIIPGMTVWAVQSLFQPQGNS